MENETLINPFISSPVTLLNPYVERESGPSTGDFLCGKYRVVERLEISSGEADLYLCKLDDITYLAKIYRRVDSIKPEVAERLKSISSPFIGKILETGTYNGHALEIQQYFMYGSLEKKYYTRMDVIKKNIIFSLNEGLKALHDNGIIHKDLKPSNIMMSDDKKHVVIIDFGISSFHEGDMTVVQTKTGMTPEYSAPETYKGLCLEESDYYSMGITLYELFARKTPYKGLSSEQIEQYSALQRIPFPDDMPEELQELIQGLTYADLANRNDKSNPNRRWGYEEVKKWLAGEPQVIPGEGAGMKKTVPYSFLHKDYSELEELIPALARNWPDGKRELFRSRLYQHFRSSDRPRAQICRNAEQDARLKNGNDDLVFMYALMDLLPDSNAFFWKGKYYQGGISDFGLELIETLWKGSMSMNAFIDEILQKKILSAYVKKKDPENEAVLSAIEAIEGNYRINLRDEREKRLAIFQLAYMLSGRKYMKIDDMEFHTLGELGDHMRKLADTSFEDFRSFGYRLIMRDNLTPQFEAWLIALGKTQEIVNWRIRLRNTD